MKSYMNMIIWPKISAFEAVCFGLCVGLSAGTFISLSRDFPADRPLEINFDIVVNQYILFLLISNLTLIAAGLFLFVKRIKNTLQNLYLMIPEILMCLCIGAIIYICLSMLTQYGISGIKINIMNDKLSFMKHYFYPLLLLDLMLALLSTVSYLFQIRIKGHD